MVDNFPRTRRTFTSAWNSYPSHPELRDCQENSKLKLPTIHDSYSLDKGWGPKASKQCPTTSISSCPPLCSTETATNPYFPWFFQMINHLVQYYNFSSQCIVETSNSLFTTQLLKTNSLTTDCFVVMFSQPKCNLYDLSLYPHTILAWIATVKIKSHNVHYGTKCNW